MELLSMIQFRKYCNEHTGNIFIYDSRNDISRTKGCSCGVSHVGCYDNVVIMLNPNRICFKNKYTTVAFDCVERILLECGVYDTIYIICKNDTTKHVILIC